jgi:hypothetical protein
LGTNRGKVKKGCARSTAVAPAGVRLGMKTDTQAMVSARWHFEQRGKHPRVQAHLRAAAMGAAWCGAPLVPIAARASAGISERKGKMGEGEADSRDPLVCDCGGVLCGSWAFGTSWAERLGRPAVG